MPTIRITTDRQPWANGRALHNGDELDVDQALADDLQAKGFCEVLKAAKRAPKVADGADAE